MSFRMRLFITFTVYGVILVLITQLLVLQFNKESIKSDSLQRASNYASLVNINFTFNQEGILSKLSALSQSNILHDNIQKKQNKKILQSLFLDISKTSTHIMQLRYLDINGDEVIRINRDEIAEDPYIVEEKQLQNKADRYYFQEIIALDEDEKWYSNLDLNMEHGVIEKPFKPVLRVGMPLFHKDKKIGVLIINIFMKGLLRRVTHSQLYHVYIVDQDGYVVTEPTHKICWSRYRNFKDPLDEIPNEELEKILAKDTYFGANFYSSTLALNNSENLKLIIIPNDVNLNEKLHDSHKDLIIIFLVVLFLSLPISYFISQIPARLKNKVDILNKNLKSEAQEREILLSLFDQSNLVLFKWNNDENWSVDSVSLSVENFLGYTKEDFESGKIEYAQCIHKDDLKHLSSEMQDVLDNKEHFISHDPYRIITKSGEIRWVLDHTVVVQNKAGEIVSFVGSLSDITDLKDKEFELERLARTDQLTKIYNRVHLDEVLYTQHYRYQRNKEACSIIMLDIDFFKEVNDKHGHIVGDKFLIEFSELVSLSIRDGDILGRWGGEEFLIVLPHTNEDQALILAEKLRKKVEMHKFETVGNKTASFGICAFADSVTIEKLVDLADSALYEAKESGRNCVRVCKK